MMMKKKLPGLRKLKKKIKKISDLHNSEKEKFKKMLIC